jgi:hypothetical protein
MKTPLTLILGLIFSIQLQAQFWLPVPAEVSKIEGRILLVETEDFKCNSNVVEHLKKHWKLNDEVIGKTADEITAMLTPENAFKYLVLTGDQREEYRKSQGKIQQGTIMSIVLYTGEHAGNRNNLDLDRSWLCKMGLPSCLVSEQEIQFFAQHISNQIDFVKTQSASGNRKKSTLQTQDVLSLKTKTLLIPENKIDVDQQDIERYYKAPFKLASTSEIKSAISSNQEATAYLTVLWSDKQFRWILTAIDCKTGVILNYSKYDAFKPNFLKSKFSPESDFLSIYRAKANIGLMEIKYLGKEITKAEMK